MTKDYYKILGVAEFDSAENIKSAYRKLARKWHPDVAGNTEDVILKFKEINEAYEILSNKIKKDEYDRARRFYSYAKSGSFSRNESQTTKENSSKEKARGPKTETDKNRGIYFSWEEFFSTKQKEVKKKEDKGSPRRGEDVYTEIDITVFEAIQGTEKL